MKNISFMGVVTSTSNKQGDKFKSKNPKKSLFFTVKNESTKKALEEFGLTEYTPKDKNAEPYFQVKMSENVKRYETPQDSLHVEEFSGNIYELNDKGEKIVEYHDTDTGEILYKMSKNYSSNDKEIGIALIEGENQGNKFIRVYAIFCGEDVFTINEAQNPFAEMV